MKKAEVMKSLNVYFEENKITNVVPTGKLICPNCKGNGFTKHTFEAETHEVQCKACGSQGELPADKYFLQTYESKDWLEKWSQSVYHGPCLDHTLFRKLRILL